MVKKVTEFSSGKKLKFKKTTDGIYLLIPENEEDIDYIIILEMK